ncbi:MAG TPA: hypothetical protein VF614_00685 [Chthoniobacteraceae bacterium]|jgi:hypothetical protein
MPQVGFRFQANRPLREQLTAARLNAMLEAIEASTITQGVGYMARGLPGGQVLQITARSGGGAGVGYGRPFEVQNAGATSGGVSQVKVSLDSWLSYSARPGDKITITGLGEPFAISLGDKIWLKVAWDPLNLSAPPTATIVHGAPGTLWPDYNNPVLFDDLEEGNKKQLEWRELIAWTEALAADAAADPYLDSLVVGSGEEAFRVIQRVTMHLVLCKRCFENNNVWVTDPAFRPGPED